MSNRYQGNQGNQYQGNQGYGAINPRPLNKAGVQRTERGMFGCCNCCVAVPNDKYYVVENFGGFDGRILSPGFSWVGCDCLGICYQFRSITKRVEPNECVIETKTKDNVFVNVKVAVQQSVMKDRVEQAVYRLSDVSSQVDAYVADVVRSHVPKMSLDEAFERKDDISVAIQEQLGSKMQEFGFEIHNALVTEVRPDQQVMDSMNEINKQKRLRDAAIMAGEAEKVRVVKAAEGAADAACLQGEGIARQRAAIVEGLRSSMKSEDALSDERISELLLISQYFETLKEIGANNKSNAVFLPQSPIDGMRDISTQIRNGVLQGNMAAGATS